MATCDSSRWRATASLCRAGAEAPAARDLDYPQWLAAFHSARGSSMGIVDGVAADRSRVCRGHAQAYQHVLFELAARMP